MELIDGIDIMPHLRHNAATLPIGSPYTLGLSIGELAEIIGGQLSLGTMPPLDGAMEPVGRVVTNSRLVQSGDLFWGLPGQRTDGAQFAEDALLRGAQGTVIQGRHIEPWGGAFSIRVPDTRRALSKLMSWAQRQITEQVIAMAHGHETPTTCDVVDRLPSDNRHGTSDVEDHSNDVNKVVSMLRSPEHSAVTIIASTKAPPAHIAEIYPLCSQRIAAITAPQKTKRGERESAPHESL